jgi:hypothetical protein
MQTFLNSDSFEAYVKAELAATDWTQLPDVDIVNRDEFITYRKALRQALKIGWGAAVQDRPEAILA